MMSNNSSSSNSHGDGNTAAAVSAASSSANNNNNNSMNQIISILLQDFHDSNTPEAILSSSKILTTLLKNALTANTKDNNPKHGTIRLSNPIIQRHVVNVQGALDILGAAGFVEETAALSEGERHLNYVAPTNNDNEEHDSFQQQHQQQERRALIEVICGGLEMKIMELDPPATKKVAAAASIPSNPNPTTAAPTLAEDQQTSFLNDKERNERIQKLKAMKKAKKAHREREQLRWREDNEDRKLAAQRREALLHTKVRADDLAQNVPIGGGAKKSNLLPKPFEDGGNDDDPQAIRRQLIQRCMKDPLLTAREKQAKMQELMKMGSGALLEAANAIPATGTGSSTAAASASLKDDNEMALDNNGPTYTDMGTKRNTKGVDINDNILDRKQPAVIAATKPPPPQQPLNMNNLQTTRTQSPPSTEWTKFIQSTPRCAGAEGIRDSSALYNNAPSVSADLAVPKCLKRLFKELDGLKDDLPSDPNCSIWLRFDEETPQYIRALITAPLPGPTPYSGGVFAFDIYIPNDYPQNNPKVKLLTTGGGRVRFGPNLYADGKVCLSLLGTWAGPKWNPKHSSLYQVLISIQGLILGVEHPYYLEPGHGGWEGKVKEGDFQVTGQTLAGQSVKQEVGVPLQVVLHEDVFRVGTAKYAMIQPLKLSLERSALISNKNELEAFRDIIHAHFCENRTAIIAEVQNWMSDHALGRNRSKLGNNDSKGTGALQIDALQGLLPKLEKLLSRASMPQSSSSSLESASKVASRDNAEMDVEENLKPAAKPTSSAIKEKEQQPDVSDTQNARGGGTDPVEHKRQKMQEAEVKRLEELQKGMKEAAKNNDFIRAGRLQAQFLSLTEGTMSSAPAAAPDANADQQMNSTYNNPFDDSSDEYDSGEEDNMNMDWDDDDDMDDGPPFPQPHGHPHGIGSNVHVPPGYKGHSMSNKHSWGAGYTLAAPPAAQPSITTTAAKSPEKAAPQKSIPREQLCRLRIRLPQDKSVVEDFDKNESLSEVYRRLESLVPDQNRKQSSVAGPSVAGGGVFSQPSSSAGFTLLLTRPRREFSLEMHGTMSLLDLNLAPSATLTVMKCSERGIMYRGEVESRLKAAQGDAMDVEGLTYEGLMELTERVGKAAAKEGEAFLTLTMEEFEANTEKLSPLSYLADLENSEESGEEDRRCPICLGCYDSSDSTPSLRMVKNCGHTMHVSCLQTWLRTNSSCPLCKVHIGEGKKSES